MMQRTNNKHNNKILA